jgi:hypothetical protein
VTDTDEIIVTGSASPLSFETEGGGSWRVWDRFIAVHGAKVHHIGNVCGTCAFFFTRLPAENPRVEAAAVASELRAGIADTRDPVVRSLERLLPDGRYRTTLRRIQPRLVHPGSPEDYFGNDQSTPWGEDPADDGPPHDPRTDYYRIGAHDLGGERTLFEFLVPMFPVSSLSAPQIDAYSRALANGTLPTAVALTVLDVKSPAISNGDAPPGHWCLAHYLLDGHHKLLAASQTGLPLTLLSFLAVDQGVSTDAEVKELSAVLSGAKRSS